MQHGRGQGQGSFAEEEEEEEQGYVNSDASCFFKDPALKGLPACDSIQPSPLELQKPRLQPYAEPLRLEIFDGPPSAPYGDYYAKGRAELAPIEPGLMLMKDVSIVITSEALDAAAQADSRLDLLSMLKYSEVEVMAVVIKSSAAMVYRAEALPENPSALREVLYTIPESTPCLDSWIQSIQCRSTAQQGQQEQEDTGPASVPIEDRYFVLVFSIDWLTISPFSERYCGSWPDCTSRISYIEGPMEYRDTTYRSEAWILPAAPGPNPVSAMRFFPVPTEDPVPSHIHPSMLGRLREHLFNSAASKDLPVAYYQSLICVDLLFVEYSLLHAVRRLMTESIPQTLFDVDHGSTQATKRRRT